MEKITLLVSAALLVFAVSSQNAFAHETHRYRIGDKTYEFVVGSLNEPVAIDDKSGVDVRVREITGGDGTGSEGHGATEGAVEGLNQTLKVEVLAGGQKKIFELSPVFSMPGSYKTTFYPTVQTTFSYRLFGRLNEVPINLTFTCNPAGHPRSPEDVSEIRIADNVTRILKRGAFGCPVAKAELGFPEPSASIYDLSANAAVRDAASADFGARARNADVFALAVAGLALILAVGSYMRTGSGGAELPR